MSLARRSHRSGGIVAAALAAVLMLVLITTSCRSNPTIDVADPIDVASDHANSAESNRAASPDAGPDTEPIDVVSDDPLAELVLEYLGDEPGGVSVAVRRDGVVSFAGFGEANNSGDMIGSELSFRVGSISKPLVAVMMLQLVDEGSVDLDETVDTYLDDPIVGGDVTIRQLLAHRSGLANYTDQAGLMIRTFAQLDATVSPNEVLEAVADETHRPPGSFFSYSNTNYILAGQVIQAVDGGDIAASLQRRIAEPLGLTGTWFEFGTPSAEVAAGWSRPFFDGSAGDEYTSIASGAWAAGALISSTEDLLRFLDAVRDGELLSPETLALMTDVESGYGLGLSAVSLGPSGPGVGHNGSIPGYSSTMGISLDTGDAVIVLTNNGNLSADLLARKILQSW